MSGRPIDTDCAADLAALSRAVYSGSADRIRSKCRAEAVEVFGTTGTLGCVATLSGRMVVAFRGTPPPAAVGGFDLLRNWLTNLDWALCPTESGAVHRGFAAALDLVWPLLQRTLSRRPRGGELWLTGHSLGGALAILAAARLSGERRAAGICTFGAPRVGDTRFAGSLRISVHRVENPDDPVPLLPPDPLTAAMLNGSWGLEMPAGKEVCGYAAVGRAYCLTPQGLFPQSDDHDASAAARLAALLGKAAVVGPGRLLGAHSDDAYADQLATLCSAGPGENTSEEASVNYKPRSHISIIGEVVNGSGLSLRRLSYGQSYGIHTVPPPDTIAAGATGEFCIESNGFMTGATGYAVYAAEGVGGLFKFEYDAPFYSRNKYNPDCPDGFEVKVAGGHGRKTHVAFLVQRKPGAPGEPAGNRSVPGEPAGPH